jgi:hypothetical protein
MTAANPTGSARARPQELTCKSDAVRLLLDRMAATLVSVGCRCTHDSPYTPHVVTYECARCRCLREYREMR